MDWNISKNGKNRQHCTYIFYNFAETVFEHYTIELGRDAYIVRIYVKGQEVLKGVYYDFVFFICANFTFAPNCIYSE